MAFMQHDVRQFSAWQIDTTCGIETVPLAVAGGNGHPDALLDYLEGSPLNDEPAEKVTGWFSRLSAPGYMDCTAWSGPFDTRDAAKAHLVDMYESDEDESEDA